MAASLVPHNSAIRASEKPLRFNCLKDLYCSEFKPASLSSASMETNSSIWSKNHGSIKLSLKTSLTLKPARKASATWNKRSGPGSFNSRLMRSKPSSPNSASPVGSKPILPISRPRRAFCTDSWKVRPIAITSPTDFIWVVKRASADGNFSKAKRGILVTT